ncbi:hypothetical protein DCO58_05755 [Helicobacter saguini]|uniref:Uncharacterized protein n=1 Tax=Helicobacter saguini TaxID=1548018 RepID=A0A347VTC7_9HELI|nr:hypothetical protein [Helicobacter saguini]MWV62148.1 hypothetical protein [Helicobacter saguini]MWV67180.1 hypothetical protein [Helicobacter saguini]MWV69532.1 hypothetical protein [Helicobacter saguini]MWV70917.1 hypothetical protein [Helicobacter saguini]TLD92542.1 hypothetical protein LS64_010155 [Helicobacter saguini]
MPTKDSNYIKNPTDFLKEAQLNPSITHNQYIESDISIDMRVPVIPQHLIPFKVNPASFINAHNFPDLDALVEEVKRVDSNPELIKKMLKEPALLDINYNEARDSMLHFIESILSQEPKKAYRRGKGMFIQGYVNELTRLPKMRNIGNLLRYYKLALFIEKILSQRMYLRNKLKHLREKFKKK